MMTKNFSVALLSPFVIGLSLLFSLGTAFGSPEFLNGTGSFNATYATAYNCALCHTTPTASSSARNTFGANWASGSIGNHQIPMTNALAILDSDGDGFSNSVEVSAGTYPGDANSKPSTADTTPPTVSISAPTGGTVSGTITVSANASDNVGVVGVQFRLDGVNLGLEDTTAPYSVSWNTTTATNASHTLTAVARDAAGNTATSAGVIVTVNNSVTDTTPPTVTVFTVPATSGSLIVPITTITATDNVGVTGYMVKESATAPLASAAGWTATLPTSYTFTTAGAKTLYAWAKDAAGNVSLSRSALVTITLSSAGDTIPPTVTVFRVPATSGSLIVPITTITATDNVGVTGYMVKESAAAPLASASGWSTTLPTNYTFSTAGIKNLYVWAKDAAGNVSAGKSAIVTITTANPGPSLDLSAWVGKWFKITERDSGYSITNSGLQGYTSSYDGYIKIWSWDQVNNILHGDRYEYDAGTNRWVSEPLDMHYFAGTPLDFLCWYQVTDNTTNTSSGFNIHIQQITNNNGSVGATFRTLGGYYVEVNYSGGLTITGDLIPNSSVPIPSNVIVH